MPDFAQGDFTFGLSKRPLKDYLTVLLPQWLNFKLFWMVFPLKSTKTKKCCFFLLGKLTK